MSASSQGLWDLTLRRVRRAWPLGSRGALKDRIDPDLSESDAQALRTQIEACLGAQGGEVSARARAAELGETYLVLSPHGRKRFLKILATEYGVNSDHVNAAIAKWKNAQDSIDRAQTTLALREALRAPRVKLLAQFNALEQGVKFLVDLRAELIALSRDDPTLKSLDNDVYRLLASWFDIGFLQLARITWNSPASLLEKLTAYEAVHEIRSWQDLKNRLGEDRRCYAYFHPHMPAEPLIFVEVALVNGIADNVQKLLDPNAEILEAERTNTAIFYSISNCQAGLAGVSFGNFLIKRVASDLAGELPNVKTFCTLSPIPGFRRWFNEELAAGREIIDDKDRTLALEAAQRSEFAEAINALMDNRRNYSDDNVAPMLRRVLMQHCARYLLEARRGQLAHDRVAHFHLSNGALIERLNWAGDTSAKGLASSAGIMVNYLYRLPDIERNHEAYTDTGQVTASSAVKKLTKP